MKPHNEIINTYLYYGYLPDPDVQLPESLRRWFDGELTSSNYNNATKADLTKIGSKILIDTFQQEIANYHNSTNVVPLSGGLDSRAILANLIENFDTSKIITVTFGLPGSPDYETAKSIAKKTGLRWAGIDLSPGKMKWNTDMLINTAKQSERPTRLFDSAINHTIQLKFGKDSVYWSGFMGDSLGRVIPDYKMIKSWEAGKSAFIQKNCHCKNFSLSTTDYHPEMQLPDQPLTSTERLDYYSQLNYCIRQQCLTKHIYSPKGYDIRYPFLNPKWIAFFLSVPRNHRYHQSLYRKILCFSYPHLFNRWNSPKKDSHRLKVLIGKRYKKIYNKCLKIGIPNYFLNTPSHNVNYIDWNYALRYQDDFKNTVYSNLQDLKARKIIDWLDIDKIWTIHQNIQTNLSSELMVLAALEIHLKAKTIS